MALDQSALSELLDALRAGGDLDVVRDGLALVLQALIEAEAAQQIGAGRYERSAARTTHRNGSRARLLSTKAGDVELKIPKLAMRCVKRRLGPVSGHRGVAAQRVGAGPTTGQARTA